MTETEYIAATNLAKTRMAMQVVLDILPGFDGVTTDAEQAAILKILSNWAEGLYVKIGGNG
jgi:hypothetical protein